LEDTITKSFGKIAAIDSRRWIRFLITNLRGLTIDKIKEMNPAEQRMIQIPVINP